MNFVYIVNFKTYPQTQGQKGLEIAKILSEFKDQVWIAVPTLAVEKIAQETKIKVLAQHIDAVEPGAKTGHTTAEAVMETGAVGTLLNHSEKRISEKDIEFVVNKMKSLGGKSIVCAENLEEVKKYSKLHPDYIALEPPELIGGNKSVSKEKPDLIRKAVELSDVPVLVGAGIKTREDVVIAKDLGAKGILIASGIVKKENIRDAMKNLIIED